MAWITPRGKTRSPLLYEQPEEYFSSLAKQYNIDYVLIGDSERANYNIDYEYFANHFSVYYENDSVIIYSVH